jgi:Zn-dependent M16 (insulinase) family peptidase
MDPYKTNIFFKILNGKRNDISQARDLKIKSSFEKIKNIEKKTPFFGFF